MKPTSGSSSAARRAGAIVLGLAVACGLAGCESLQRKFTRKPKGPRAKPSPIINFQDYSRAMTAVDRYRKHYLMFDYWNDELLRALQANPLNPKRYKRASTDALDELQMIRSTLVEELAVRLDPLIEERQKLHRRIQAEQVGIGTVNAITRALEAQTRLIHREFFWRQVEDQLKPWPPAQAAQPAEAAPMSAGGDGAGATAPDAAGAPQAEPAGADATTP